MTVFRVEGDIVTPARGYGLDLLSQFGEVIASKGVCESWSRLLHGIDTFCNRMETRAEIATLEAELMKMPQSDHVLDHQFAEGLYIRYVEIPAGCLFTTPVHKVESVLTVLKGKIIIITEDGADIMDSPCYITTKPGAKRVILALSGVMATTVHPNPDNCRDLEVLESRIYAKSFDEIEVVA